MSVTVEYVHHSCYVVETKDAVLIFDYVQGNLPRHYLESSKLIIFFVTHSHEDHYNPGIFNYKKQVIASDDVRVPLGKDAIMVKEKDSLIMEGLHVSVFGSTDLGVSFLVKTEDVSVFHAGDLNHWHWKDESTQDEIDIATYQFLNIIEDIKGNVIDIAMFPVDPRMKKDFDSGARVFTQELKPTCFFAMHYSDAKLLESFRKWSENQKNSRIYIPSKDNEKVECTINNEH